MTTALALDRIARRVADVTTGAAVMPAASGLLLKKSCGETSCDSYYMCSAHDLRCYPCHDYCDDTSNNFDARICEQQCQDYIHDYMKHYATDENIQDALKALENLKSLVIFMTVLVAIALVFISTTLLFIWKRERRIRKIKNGGQDSFFKKKLASLQYLKKKDKQQTLATVSETVMANHQLQTAAAACTSLAATQTELTTVVSTGCGGASSSSSASSSGQRTNTSSAGASSSGRGGGSSSNSNKLPCEDVALEFSGYDNFAMKVSPVLPGKTATTTTAAAVSVALPHQLQFTP